MLAGTLARWQRESHPLSRFFVLGSLLVVLALALATLPLPLGVLLVGGGIFVTLTLIEPRWALYLLPLAVPFGSIREVAVGPATVGGTEALLGLFLAAWVARGIARRDLVLHRPPLLVPIALWYGVMLLSTLGSRSLSASLKELLKWGETFALYTIAAQTLRPRDAAILVATTLAAGSLAALEGIYQSLFRVGPDGFLFPLAGRFWLRAYGRFIQPNPYAGYLGLVLPLAYGLVAAGLGNAKRGNGGTGERGEERVGAKNAPWIVLTKLPSTYPSPAEESGTQPAGANSHELLRAPASSHKLPIANRFTRGTILVLAVASGALLAVALFLTLSRGGWIGAGVAALAVGALLSRRAALLSLGGAALAALALALGAAQLLPEALARRATDFLPYINVFNVNVRGVGITDQNFAVIERLAHWQAAYEMWADAPWLGQGVGNYVATYPLYFIPPWKEPLGHAHNLFLNTLAETGLIGLVAYLIFWASALWLCVRAVRRSEGPWRGVAVGALGAMVHLHVHNFFDNLYVHGMYLHLALLLALAAVLARPQPTPISTEER